MNEIKRILSLIILGIPVPKEDIYKVICLGTPLQASFAKNILEAVYGERQA